MGIAVDWSENTIEWKHIEKNRKNDDMLHHLRFYSSKSSPFRVNYLGSDYCKID